MACLYTTVVLCITPGHTALRSDRREGGGYENPHICVSKFINGFLHANIIKLADKNGGMVT